MSRRSRVPAAFAVAVLTAVSAPVAQAAEEPTPPFDQVANCVSFGRAIEPVSDAVSPGQRLVGQTQLWELSRGAGVTVAVIDTGVNPGPAFGDRLRGGADLVVPDSATAGLQDCDGHGTLVAGLIGAAPDTTSGFAGVAPDVQLLSIRHNSLAFAPKGTRTAGVGGVGSLAQAIDLAVSKGADVINISSAYCGPALTANDERLTAAVDRAVAADVVVVVAAGNLGTTAACSAQNMPGQAPVTGATPANIPSALTVGAVTAAGQPAEFSLAGSWVDLAAPGAKVISTNPHPTQSGQVGTVVGTEGDVEIQGTSFAAPYVTGIVALVRARFPRLTAAQVVFRLQATADHPAGTGEQNIFVGHGIVNARRALTAVLPAEGGESAPAPTRAAALPGGTGSAPEAGGGSIAVIGSGLLLAVLVAAVLARSIRRRAAATRSGIPT